MNHLFRICCHDVPQMTKSILTLSPSTLPYMKEREAVYIVPASEETALYAQYHKINITSISLHQVRCVFISRCISTCMNFYTLRLCSHIIRIGTAMKCVISSNTFPSPRYSLTELLGSGQFGVVNKGVWQSPRGQVEVAVKMLKEGSDQFDRVKFLHHGPVQAPQYYPALWCDH